MSTTDIFNAATEGDHKAIRDWLSPHLEPSAGTMGAPVWGGPDSAPSPMAQVFNYAKGSVGADALAVTLRPIAIADSVYFDSATPSVTGIYIPGVITSSTECRMAIDFDQYPMPVSAAASGGGSTVTSASGGGSTTASGGGAVTDEDGGHIHVFATWNSNTPGAWAKRQYTVPASGGAMSVNLETETAASTTLRTGGEDATHHHTAPAHTHGTPNHTHDSTIPNHTHALTATASKEAYPGSHSVNLIVSKLVGASWVQQGATITGITTDAPDLDLSTYITGAGRWRVVLQSAAAQPNGGRLGAHLSGYFVGVIPN